MQMQMPFFPSNTKYFNPTTGVFEKDNFVYYLHNGLPIFCHQKNDRILYRFITANLVENRLCKPSEIAKVLGVSARSIQLNAKALREKGSDWFLNRTETRGTSNKYTADTFQKAKEMLNTGKSNCEIARFLNVSECSVRYHKKKGTLKKNQ